MADQLDLYPELTNQQLARAVLSQREMASGGGRAKSAATPTSSAARSDTPTGSVKTGSTHRASPALSLGPQSGGGDLAFLDEAMTEARRNWNVMLQDDFNPIAVALEMLNGNNPAYDYQAFLTLQQQIERGMAVIVDSKQFGLKPS